MTQLLVRAEARAPTRTRPVVNFVWHFLEMCAAMCVAWMLVTLPFIAIAGLAGTSDPVRSWPEVATLLAVVAMSAGMAVQMRWRRHSWRCTAEMTAAMALEAVVIFALAAGGVLSRDAEFAWYHAFMPLAMIVAMLHRRDVYTAPVNAHRTAHAG